MMMVVTEVAVALHLIQKLREDPPFCQIRHRERVRLTVKLLSCLRISSFLPPLRRQRGFLFLQQIDNVLVQAIAQFESLRCARHIANLDVDIGP